MKRLFITQAQKYRSKVGTVCLASGLLGCAQDQGTLAIIPSKRGTMVKENICIRKYWTANLFANKIQQCAEENDHQQYDHHYRLQNLIDGVILEGNADTQARHDKLT